MPYAHYLKKQWTRCIPSISIKMKLQFNIFSPRLLLYEKKDITLPPIITILGVRHCFGGGAEIKPFELDPVSTGAKKQIDA